MRVAGEPAGRICNKLRCYLYGGCFIIFRQILFMQRLSLLTFNGNGCQVSALHIYICLEALFQPYACGTRLYQSNRIDFVEVTKERIFLIRT